MDSISSLMNLGSMSTEAPVARAGRQDEAAKELEGMFMSLLLKEMRQSIGSENGFAGDPSDTIGGLFDQMMGDHLAAAGGLGIADSIRGTLLGSPTP